MAVTRKYAGLPDLDRAPEIYETPELTDDASTVQTSTLRTESPSPSEEGQHPGNFDRGRLNQDDARRKFEPAVVGAKGSNLSDSIGNSRKGYIVTHRRRRRRRVQHQGDEDLEGEFSDISSEEEETVTKKLARLRREAEEVRLELEIIEKERDQGASKDGVEQPQAGAQGMDGKDLFNGFDQLNEILNSLNVGFRRPKGETIEQEFNRQLLQEKDTKIQQQNLNGNGAPDTGSNDIASSSAISAIAAFSDRLTTLETALGLSAIIPNTNPSSIIPSLDNLTAQVDGIASIIDPKQAQSPAQRDHLELLTNRLHALHIDADRLLSTRKAAIQALTQIVSHHAANERQRNSQNLDSHDVLNHGENTNDTNPSRPRPKDNRTSSHGGIDREIAAAASEEQRIVTSVFLEEQSAKITALYNTLPTIQNLQPLLPVVLERLRGLSVIHASAATAQSDMDDLEQRLAAWEKELGKWNTAVQGVESGIEECKVVMRENVDFVGGMVRGLEGRVDELLKVVK